MKGVLAKILRVKHVQLQIPGFAPRFYDEEKAATTGMSGWLQPKPSTTYQCLGIAT